MQQLTSRPQPDQQVNRGAPRSQVILIVALLLFSVAGLASGFSVGALSRKTSKTPQPTQITSIMSQQKGKTAAPTPKPIVKITPLGCPQPTTGTSTMFQQQDGTTSYTFTTQAIDNTGTSCGVGRPIHSTGITFKIWLTKLLPINKKIQFSTNILTHPAQFTKPLEIKAGNKNYQELQNELQFSTAQVQQSNNQGQVIWHYTINPDLKDGTYTLVLLDDWQGQTYNWSWFDLIVKKQG
jgi:hypothetical protein